MINSMQLTPCLRALMVNESADRKTPIAQQARSGNQTRCQDLRCATLCLVSKLHNSYQHTSSSCTACSPAHWSVVPSSKCTCNASIRSKLQSMSCCLCLSANSQKLQLAQAQESQHIPQVCNSILLQSVLPCIKHFLCTLYKSTIKQGLA